MCVCVCMYIELAEKPAFSRTQETRRCHGWQAKLGQHPNKWQDLQLLRGRVSIYDVRLMASPFISQTLNQKDWKRGSGKGLSGKLWHWWKITLCGCKICILDHRTPISLCFPGRDGGPETVSRLSKITLSVGGKPGTLSTTSDAWASSFHFPC